MKYKIYDKSKRNTRILKICNRRTKIRIDKVM